MIAICLVIIRSFVSWFGEELGAAASSFRSEIVHSGVTRLSKALNLLPDCLKVFPSQGKDGIEGS
jgi:hypothetical protein